MDFLINVFAGKNSTSVSDRDGKSSDHDSGTASLEKPVHIGDQLLFPDYDFPADYRGRRLAKDWNEIDNPKGGVLAFYNSIIDTYEQIVPDERSWYVARRHTTPTTTRTHHDRATMKQSAQYSVVVPPTVDEVQGHPAKMVGRLARELAGVATCSACGGADLALSSRGGDPLLGCPVHGRTMLDWEALLHIYHTTPNQVVIEELTAATQALGTLVKWSQVRHALFQLGKALPESIVSLLLAACNQINVVGGGGEKETDSSLGSIDLISALCFLVANCSPALYTWNELINRESAGSGAPLRSTGRVMSYGPAHSRSSLMASLSMIANRDAWTAALVEAGAVEALIMAADNLRSFPAFRQQCAVPRDDDDPKNSLGAEVITRQQRAQVEALCAVGVLLSTHPRSARNRLLACGGGSVLKQVLLGWKQEGRGVVPGYPLQVGCTADPISFLPPLNTIDDSFDIFSELYSCDDVSLLLAQFLVLLLLDLCLRVPSPGHSIPISSSKASHLNGTDVVSCVAGVLEDGLFPLLSQLATCASAASPTTADVTTPNDELGGGLDWCLGFSCSATWPERGTNQGQTRREVCMSYALLLHNKRGQLGEVGRELLTSSHVLANLDAAVYQRQPHQQLPEELSVWCPARALHLVSRAVANLLKSVSQEGESGNLRLNSFEKPIVGQKKAEPGMQQPLQGNGTFYCKSYPSISVSMLLDIIIKDFERAAEVHLATNPITCPQEFCKEEAATLNTSDHYCSKSFVHLNPVLLCVLIRLLLFSVTELGNPAAIATAVKTMTSYLGKETGFYTALLSTLHLGEDALNHSDNLWQCSDASLSEAQHNYRLPLPSCGGFSNFIAWGAAKDAVLALLDALGGDKMVLSWVSGEPVNEVPRRISSTAILQAICWLHLKVKSSGLKGNHSEFSEKGKAVETIIRSVKKCVINDANNRDGVLSMPLKLALLSLIGCVEGKCRAFALRHSSEDLFSLMEHGPSKFRRNLLHLVMSSVLFLETEEEDDTTSINSGGINLLLSRCLECAVTFQSKSLVCDILDSVNISLLQPAAETSNKEIQEMDGRHPMLRGRLREQITLHLVLLLDRWATKSDEIVRRTLSLFVKVIILPSSLRCRPEEYAFIDNCNTLRGGMEGKVALLSVLRQLQGKERRDDMVYGRLGITLSQLPLSLAPDVFWTLLSLLLYSPQNTCNIEEYSRGDDCHDWERKHIVDPNYMPLLLTLAYYWPLPLRCYALSAVKDLLVSPCLPPPSCDLYGISVPSTITDVEESYARYNVAICCQTRPSCINILLNQLDAQSRERAEQEEIWKLNAAAPSSLAGVARTMEEDNNADVQQQLECFHIDIVKILGTCSLEVPQLRKLMQIIIPVFPSSHSYFKDVTRVSNKGHKTGSDSIVSPPVRPRHLTQIALAMSGMMEDTDGPRSFLLLGGRNKSNRVTEDDGIIVSSFPKWPFSRGYTFTCWLRPTGCHSSLKEKGIRPCLARLIDKSGRGFEIYLKGGLDKTVSDCEGTEAVNKGNDNDVDLVIVSLHSGGRAPIETTICSALSSSQWGFVAVKHLVTGFGSKGELSAFCAIGRATGVVSVKRGWHRFVKRYPRIPSNEGTMPTVRFACDGFEGELGPLYMFQDALSDDQVEGIHLLGPNYNLDFRPSSIQRFLREETKLALPLSRMGSGDTTVLKSSLLSMSDSSLSKEISKETKKLINILADRGSHLIFAYNSALRRKFKSTLLLLDGARQGLPWPQHHNHIEEGKASHHQPLPFASFHAELMSPRALSVNMSDIRDVLASAGGVEVLLPLFALVDLPVTLDEEVLESHQTMSDDDHSNQGQNKKASPSYDANFKLMDSLLALLSGALRDDTASAVFILEKRGLELLAHCLEHASVRCVGSGSLVRICQLIGRLGGWHTDWADQAISCLLANFNIWAYALEDAQILMAKVLKSLCESQPGRMRCVVGVQRLLDGLSLTFNRKSCAKNCAMSGGRRRTDEVTLNKVHRSLLDCVYSMVTHGEGISTLEAHAIISQLFSYLGNIPPTIGTTTMAPMDVVNTCELLQLVLRLLQSPSRLKGGRLGGAHRFVLAAGTSCSSFASPSLLSATFPPIRILSLLCLSSIVKSCMKMQQLKDEPFESSRNDVCQSPFNGDNASDTVSFSKDGTQLSVRMSRCREKETAPALSRTVLEPDREEYLSNILSIIEDQHQDNDKRSKSSEEVLELNDSPWSVAGLGGADLDGGCELLNILLMAQQMLNLGLGQDMYCWEATAVLSIFEALTLGNVPEELVEVALQLKIGELGGEGGGMRCQNIQATHEVYDVGLLDSFFSDGLSAATTIAAEVILDSSEEEEKHENAQWFPSTGHDEYSSGNSCPSLSYGIIRLPTVLPSLLHCLAYYTLSPSERLKWVKRLACMLTCNGNEGALLGIDNWQRYLFDAVISARNRREKVVENICIRLLAWVSMHALFHNGDESVLRQTVSLVRAEIQMVTEVSEDSSSDLDNNKTLPSKDNTTVDLELVGVSLLSLVLHLLKREVGAIAEASLPWWMRHPRGSVVSMETLKCRRFIVQKGIWAIAALIVEFVALSPTENRFTEATAVELSSHEEHPTTQRTLLYCSRLDNPDLWQLIESLLGLFSPMGDTLLVSGGDGTATENENFVSILSPADSSSSSQIGDGTSLLDDGRETDGHQSGAFPPHIVSAFKDHNRKHKDQSSGDGALGGAGGIPWMLLRLLLGVFIRGGDDVKREGYDDVRHNSLVALQMCISLLNSLRNNGCRFYRFEIVHAVAVLASSLRQSKCNPTSPWSVGGLQLLVKCMQDESDAIKSLLLSATEHNPLLSRIRFGSRQNLKGGFWQFMDDMLLSWKFPNFQNGMKKVSKDAAYSSSSNNSNSSHGGSISQRHCHSESGYDSATEMFNLELNSLPIADVTRDTLCRGLRVELNFGDLNDSTTAADNEALIASHNKRESFWEIWDAAMVSVLQEAASHEKTALKRRVDASNQHAHSSRLLDDLRLKCIAFKRLYEDRMSYFSKNLMDFRTREKERAASLLETKEKDEKLRKGIWESILARLAVERGIWGTGATRTNLDVHNRIARHGEITTSWILDEWEDDLSRHLRLLRNHHCKFSHRVGAVRARGNFMIGSSKAEEEYSHNVRQNQESQDNIHVNAEEEEEKEPGDISVSVSVSAVEGSNEGWLSKSNISPANLWKDLCKCRAIRQRGYDASAVEDEPFEVEEESSLPQLSSADILHTISAEDDMVIASMLCKIVRPYCISRGCFYISKQQCAFVQDTHQRVPTQDKASSIGGINSHRNSPLCPFPTTVWALNDILSLEMLPYRYQPVGLELFFFNSPPILLVMQTEEDCW